MDKKNRTGLQSKISHIFAGVPVPKKKTHLPDNSEPEKKDGISDIKQHVADDFVIEQSVNENKAANPNLEDDITEVSFSNESIEYPETDLKRQNEPKKFQPKPLVSFKKSPIDKQLEDELSKEQFTIVSEPDIANKTPDSESEVVISDSNSLDNLLSPDKSKPVSQDKQSLVQKPLREEKEEKKQAAKNVVAEPSVKKEKEEKSENKKTTIPVAKDTNRTPKSIVSDVPGLKEEQAKITRIPRRTSLKTKGKSLKSQPAASQPRQKLMIGLIIVLPILLVLVLLNNNGFFDSGSNNKVISEKSLIPAVSAKTPVNLKINWPQIPVYPDVVRDPMEISEFGVNSYVNNVLDHPDFDVSGTSNVEGGEYRVSIIINNASKLPLEKNAVIKDSKGRDVKIIDINLNQVVFEMGTVLWTYDLRSKKWTKIESKDTLGN